MESKRSRATRNTQAKTLAPTEEMLIIVYQQSFLTSRAQLAPTEDGFDMNHREHSSLLQKAEKLIPEAVDGTCFDDAVNL